MKPNVRGQKVVHGKRKSNHRRAAEMPANPQKTKALEANNRSRKNKNKASKANHSRKRRAAKKAGGGML